MKHETIVNEYFDLFEQMLTDLNLSTKPKQLYNCDDRLFFNL